MARAVVSKEERRRKEAGRKFVDKAHDPSYVAKLLSDSGVERPPCRLCQRQKENTCPHTVGNLNCRDFVPYTNSPEKLEKGFLTFIEEEVGHKAQLKEERKPK